MLSLTHNHVGQMNSDVRGTNFYVPCRIFSIVSCIFVHYGIFELIILVNLILFLDFCKHINHQKITFSLICPISSIKNKAKNGMFRSVL